MTIALRHAQEIQKQCLIPCRKFPAKLAAKATPRTITVLGSTGSVGKSTLALVRAFPERFRVQALAAKSSALELAQQIREFKPTVAVLLEQVSDKELLEKLRQACLEAKCELLFGEQNVCKVAADEKNDVVVAAIVGMAGLRPVISALEQGIDIALANKEPLVAAGVFVARATAKYGARILPVDSEHSAIFQALQGAELDEVESVVITASGGPFLTYPIGKLSSVTPEEAIKHPRWHMGAKISVDSATMVNKGLEMIEAAWLFGLRSGQIEVLIHPESIVHSLVRFRDGSLLAQLASTDMRGPIGYALAYPHRELVGSIPRLNLAELGRLNFQDVDLERFPAIALARDVLNSNRVAAAAIFNIANELAVQGFLTKCLDFVAIVPIISEALEKFEATCVDELEGLFQLEASILEWFNTKI